MRHIVNKYVWILVQFESFLYYGASYLCVIGHLHSPHRSSAIEGRHKITLPQIVLFVCVLLA